MYVEADDTSTRSVAQRIPIPLQGREQTQGGRHDSWRPIMSKLSPLQRTKKEFGSKKELAAKVSAFLTKPEEEEQAAFEHRVSTMSNAKLLRLWDAQQTLEKKFGSVEALAEKITRARFNGLNADYQRKISGFGVPKLLDLARQHGVK